MSEFDKLVERRGSGSIKWDVAENELPMWVADMDFKAPSCVLEALQKRVEHGVFGYCMPDEAWAKAYVDFYGDLYGWTIDLHDLIFCLGVVAVCSSSVRALTEVGDHVAIFTPVYNIFFNSIRNAGRVPVEVPLLEKDGAFTLNYAQIEQVFAQEKTKLCIFCNPHNPVGKIYSKDELSRLLELAKRYDVRILSDEIHGPISKPGKPYVPFLSIEGASSCVYSAISPTKAFNLAGIHTSAIVIPNPEIRKKVERQINTDEVAEPNVFSCVASTAALNEGRKWLEQMNEYVFANRARVSAYIRESIPQLRVIDGEATYLLWVDCRGLTDDVASFLSFLRKKTGLYITDGAVYGKGGEGYARINLATQAERIEDFLKRLTEGVRLFLNDKR